MACMRSACPRTGPAFPPSNAHLALHQTQDVIARKCTATLRLDAYSQRLAAGWVSIPVRLPDTHAHTRSHTHARRPPSCVTHAPHTRWLRYAGCRRWSSRGSRMTGMCTLGTSSSWCTWRRRACWPATRCACALHPDKVAWLFFWLLLLSTLGGLMSTPYRAAVLNVYP